MEISKIKGIEKIDEYFYPFIEEMYTKIAADENIEKVVAFGPIVNHDADVDKDTELFMAVYYKEDYIKNFTEGDFFFLGADVEEGLRMIWVCTPQSPRYDECVSIKKDIARGVTIYECSRQGNEG